MVAAKQKRTVGALCSNHKTTRRGGENITMQKQGHTHYQEECGIHSESCQQCYMSIPMPMHSHPLTPFFEIGGGSLPLLDIAFCTTAPTIHLHQRGTKEEEKY